MANTEVGSDVKIELTAEGKRERLRWALENVHAAPFMHRTPWSMSPVAVLMDLGNEFLEPTGLEAAAEKFMREKGPELFAKEHPLMEKIWARVKAPAAKPSPELHDFGAAWSALRNGHRIRRQGWKPGAFLRVNVGEYGMVVERFVDCMRFTPSTCLQDDMFAEDWEIHWVEEKCAGDGPRESVEELAEAYAGVMGRARPVDGEGVILWDTCSLDEAEMVFARVHGGDECPCSFTRYRTDGPGGDVVYVNLGPVDSLCLTFAMMPEYGIRPVRRRVVGVDRAKPGADRSVEVPVYDGPLCNPVAGVTLTLADRIREAVNCVSRENESDTPDFILAEFMIGALRAFEDGVNARRKWYGGREESPRVVALGEDVAELRRRVSDLDLIPDVKR